MFHQVVMNHPQPLNLQEEQVTVEILISGFGSFWSVMEPELAASASFYFKESIEILTSGFFLRINVALIIILFWFVHSPLSMILVASLLLDALCFWLDYDGASLEPGKPISTFESNSGNDDSVRRKLGSSGLNKSGGFPVLEEVGSVLQEEGECEKHGAGFANSSGYVCASEEQKKHISVLKLNLADGSETIENGDFHDTEVEFPGLDNNGDVPLLEEEGFGLNQLLDYQLHKSIDCSSVLMDFLEKRDINFEFQYENGGVLERGIGSTELETLEIQKFGRLGETEEIQHSRIECGSSLTAVAAFDKFGRIEDGSSLTATAGFDEFERIEDGCSLNDTAGFDEFERIKDGSLLTSTAGFDEFEKIEDGSSSISSTTADLDGFEIVEEISMKLMKTSNGLHEEKSAGVPESEKPMRTASRVCEEEEAKLQKNEEFMKAASGSCKEEEGECLLEWVFVEKPATDKYNHSEVDF